MTGQGGRCRGLLVFAALAAMLAVASPAAADRAFSTRFSTNDTGNIAVIANTLETCPAVASTCAAARAAVPIASGGNNFSNNNFNMTYVNTDPGTVGGVATFNSSSSQLSLPAGATVLFAGLYWGADTSKGNSVGAGPVPAPAPNAAANNQVGFKVPGAAGYSPVTASAPLDTSNGATTRYSAFANVTSMVTAAGSGTYSVANVQAGIGGDRYAGWAMFVVYHDSSDPPRNLTVDDGFQTVSSNSPPITIPIGGFQTPPSGVPTVTVGFLAYEGDTGITGDTASLDGFTANSAARPATNFFDGAISNFGVNVTTRNPDDVNNFAIDAAELSGTGAIPNGATSATVQLTTSGDTYFPAVVTFATDLFAPIITSTKSVTNLTHPGGPDQRGDVLQYTVSYENTGADDATGFVMRDPIPSGSTYVPGSLRVTQGPQTGAKTDALDGDSAQFNSNANAVVFGLGSGATGSSGGSIADGETDTATFQVKIDASDTNGQQIVNTANASYSGASLGHSYTNQSPQVTNTVAGPDLTILKSHSGPFVGGVPKAFQLDVSNVGDAPTDGSPVTVTDQLPQSSFQSVSGASGSGWSCNVAGLTVTCTRSDPLAAGATYPPIEIDAVVQPLPPMTISNTATVAGGGDLDLENNTATDSDQASALADLTIAKVAQPTTVYSGNQVTYTLSVANAGPSTASGVTVSDPLDPSVYSNVNVTSTQGTCDATVSCSLGAMLPFSTATITVTATATADNTTLHNTATVSSPTPDSDSSNNTASAAVTVLPTADLSITKTGTPSNPTAGQTYTYTLTASNKGPDAASGVVVSDNLPSQFTATSATGGGFTCQVPASAGGTLVCTRPTLSVAEGAQAITVVGTFVGGSGAETAANVATVSSQTADPDQSNNSAGLTQVIMPAADLIVSKGAFEADGTTPLLRALNPGDSFDYDVTVINNGPSPAANVVVSDPLPTGIVADPGRLAPAGCTFDAGTNTFTCDIAALAAGDSLLLKLPVQVAESNPGGDETNTATVTSDTPDPDLTSNTARSTVGVATVTDLELTKAVSEPSATVGDTVTFTMTAANLGPNPTGALITDPLPAGMSFGTSSDCTFSAPNVTCDLGGLAVGASDTATFTATVNSAAAGTTITNSASVASEAAGAGFPEIDDLDPSNNLASAVLPVDQQADLSLTKTASNATPSVGQLLTYTLTASNAGPNDATGVTITDPVPPGLAFAEASNGCTNISGTVTCAIGDIPTGGHVSVKVMAWVLDSAAATAFTNLATVSGDQPDPDPANNQATANTEVPPFVNLRMTKSASNTSPAAGSDVTYTIAVSNDGPNTATGVILRDPLPNGLTYVSSTAAQGSCGASANLVTCALGSLPAGGSTMVTITARTGSDTGDTNITNTATVSATEDNGSPGLSTAHVVVNPSAVPPPPDAKLTITKTVNHKRARFGSTLRYTITVANAGPATAEAPTVTDTLSTAASIVSVHPSSGSCHGRNPLTCKLASIAPGGDATITVAARPRDLGKIRNSASVTTATPLAPGSRTMAKVTTVITAGAHSRIRVTDRTSTPKIPPGGTATFLPRVTNPNPWPVHNVKVCDQLPPGTMFVSASQGSKRRGRVVCWSVGTLAPHASKSFSMRAETLLGVTGTLRDAATAKATAGSKHLSAHAHAHVLVAPTQLCGTASSLALHGPNNPLAVAAC
jgi:uncharacterized repeat protein (TIGR01451 family)